MTTVSTAVAAAPQPRASGLFERVLRPFSDVHEGEGLTALLMLANLFLLMTGYYILKTVREPLILTTGGAELKAYASAGQALSLMVFVPLYGWFSSRVARLPLIVGFVGFFLVTLELFYVGISASVPFIGFIFFIWLGIFSLATVAQFWSFANDIYRLGAGERLFPLIGIGATAGSPVGAKVASELFEAGISMPAMLQIAAALLVIHLLLYWWINRREEREAATARREDGAAESGKTPLSGAGGFQLVFRSTYLKFVVLLLVLLNVVNTTGEYVLGRTVVEAATEAVNAGQAADAASFIGGFYGDFFFWVNLLAMVIQAFAVSRIVKHLGMAGVLLILPFIAFGAYGLIGLGAGLAVLRWVKTAENATDYSLMNTGRQLFWLPTDRNEKYKAKQAADTFFVRTGDLFSAAIVYAGTSWFTLSVSGFAWINVLIVLAWLVVAVRTYRHYRLLCAACP
ncbi:MAG: translocase [Luteitalea sp.]|nr:translocase [Luteitalea sp.]